MITINTWRDPYDAGFTTTKPKQVSFQPGLTVLVGCNGAGKSTLLMNIKEEVAEQKLPCHSYDNLVDGGNHLGAILGGYGEEGDDLALGLQKGKRLKGISQGNHVCIKVSLNLGITIIVITNFVAYLRMRMRMGMRKSSPTSGFCYLMPQILA